MRVDVRLSIACLVLAVGAGVHVAAAQEPTSLPTQDLAAWTTQLAVPENRWQETPIRQVILETAQIDLPTIPPVVGLGVRGVVRFRSGRALARIVMIDDRSHEYLLFETYSLVAGASAVRLRHACRETCLMVPAVPSRLRVELVDASVEIEALVAVDATAAAAQNRGAAPTAQDLQTIKQAQETEFVARLNQQIEAQGLKWAAGETDISRLPYAEKAKILGCTSTGSGSGPNLQGAEYYVGGILEVPRGDEASPEPTPALDLIEAFDWRARHGANRDGSPYYDADPAGGGWMTSIKSQRCADCWAHSALGATEALVNLYFNRHIDVDLSEQELVSCSGAGSCRSGGNTGSALSYVGREGVVDEACFPESGLDEPCGNCCLSPREQIAINGYEGITPSEGADQIKRKLITAGPLPFGIASWWHAMVLTGYDRDFTTGETIWILKNSWGAGWGENGYGRVKVPLTDIYLTYRLYYPIITLTPYSIACRDADGDGFFNWGVSTDGFFACGDVPPMNDCDDSNPSVSQMTDSGHCMSPLNGDTTAPILTAVAGPPVLWPPNGLMVPVVIAGTVTDAESGVNPGTVAYELNDEYGRIASTGSIAVASDGSYEFTITLQASRRKYDADGRQYVVIVRADDWAGNTGATRAVVTVPLLMKRDRNAR